MIGPKWVRSVTYSGRETTVSLMPGWSFDRDEHQDTETFETQRAARWAVLGRFISRCDCEACGVAIARRPYGRDK